MKTKRRASKVVTNLALALALAAGISHRKANAITGDPKNLPEGWEIRYERQEQRTKGRKIVEINGKKYKETLITTTAPIGEGTEKYYPLVWITTDLDGSPVEDKEICEKADLTATVAYLTDKKENWGEELSEMSDAYKRTSHLTATYDVVENVLKKSLEVESSMLATQVTGGASDLSSATKMAIKQAVNDYKNELLNELTKKLEIEKIKDPSELISKIKEVAKESVYFKFFEVSEDLQRAAQILKDHTGDWTYEEASIVYNGWKNSRVKGTSNLELWSKLHGDHTWQYATKEITKSLAEGVGIPLEEILSKDSGIKNAFQAMEEKAAKEANNFSKLEKMFEQTENHGIELFLNQKVEQRFSESGFDKLSREEALKLTGEYWTRASMLMEEKQYPKATEQLHKALEIANAKKWKQDSKNISDDIVFCHHKLAEGAFQRKDYDIAIREFKNASKFVQSEDEDKKDIIMGNLARCYVNWGAELFWEKDYSGVNEKLENALKFVNQIKGKGKSEQIDNLYIDKSKGGSISRKSSTIEDIVTNNLSRSYDNLAVQSHSLGRYRKAIAEWEKALEFAKEEQDVTRIKNNLATGYHKIAFESYKAEDYEKAVEEWKKALSLASDIDKIDTIKFNIATSYNNYGAMLFKQGYYEKGMEYFQRAENTYPSDISKHNLDVVKSYSQRSDKSPSLLENLFGVTSRSLVIDGKMRREDVDEPVHIKDGKVYKGGKVIYRKK